MLQCTSTRCSIDNVGISSRTSSQAHITVELMILPIDTARVALV